MRTSKGGAEAGEDFLADPAVEVLDVAERKARRIPSKAWRECIKKVWEVDPLICPHCRAEMKIVSFVNEATVIRRIVDHLGLWAEIKPVSRRRWRRWWAANLCMSRSMMAGGATKSRVFS